MTNRTNSVFLTALLAGALLAACQGPAESQRTVPAAMPSGENVFDTGTHEIHVNALSTDQVTPEIAQLYGITRSAKRALLNVAVRDKSTGQTMVADVSVGAVNLTGQRKNITMRKIEEPSADSVAIYYIGEVPVANRETLIFDVAVTLPGAAEPVSVKFRRQFFSD